MDIQTAFELAVANGSVAEALDYPAVAVPLSYEAPPDTSDMLSTETRRMLDEAERTASAAMAHADLVRQDQRVLTEHGVAAYESMTQRIIR